MNPCPDPQLLFIRDDLVSDDYGSVLGALMRFPELDDHSVLIQRAAELRASHYAAPPPTSSTPAPAPNAWLVGRKVVDASVGRTSDGGNAWIMGRPTDSAASPTAPAAVNAFTPASAPAPAPAASVLDVDDNTTHRVRLIKFYTMCVIAPMLSVLFFFCVVRLACVVVVCVCCHVALCVPLERIAPTKAPFHSGRDCFSFLLFSHMSCVVLCVTAHGAAVVCDVWCRASILPHRHNPAKLANVDTILTKYRGRETQLFQHLARRYGLPVSAVVTPPVASHNRCVPARPSMCPTCTIVHSVGSPIPVVVPVVVVFSFFLCLPSLSSLSGSLFFSSPSSVSAPVAPSVPSRVAPRQAAAPSPRPHLFGGSWGGPAEVISPPPTAPTPPQSAPRAAAAAAATPVVSSPIVEAAVQAGSAEDRRIMQLCGARIEAVASLGEDALPFLQEVRIAVVGEHVPCAYGARVCVCSCCVLRVVVCAHVGERWLT